ncbi:phosphate acetyltransferase [Pelagicoccus sp. SDUM812003]|uniref:phosphate acetyltransferase n=1 Tax=Pelagicoccus sp. SDUM812003 TaxID=3041267 RepID=UPI0028104ABE|nr:phosphate acetyltransferase [Pelagicoccus sp. SDUM812003]MDQ8201891.1 phosphate acetyltransferase [Pelagicoccus sp. SDUM812003]
MNHVFLTVPTGARVGLSTVSIGLVRALERQGVRVGFFKPIAQPMSGDDSSEDRSTQFIRSATTIEPPEPFSLAEARQYLSEEKIELLLENIVRRLEEAAQDLDVIIVEGLLQTDKFPMGAKLNQKLAQTLSAQLILVSALGNRDLENLNREIELAVSEFKGRVAGSVINKADLTVARESIHFDGISLDGLSKYLVDKCPVFEHEQIPLIGLIPHDQKLLAPRVSDVAKLVEAKVINEGDMNSRRVFKIELCARNVPNMLHTLKTGNLLVTPSDRTDIILAASMASLNGARLAGLILTSNQTPDERIYKLCKLAWDTGLPVLQVDKTSFETARVLHEMNLEIATDDYERINQAMDTVAVCVNSEWIRGTLSSHVKRQLSPPAFRHMLTRTARSKRKRIVLPEGDEPRTIQAAVACVERDIAGCVLLADPDNVRIKADAMGITLPPTLEIINPDDIRENYVESLVDMRRHKNMTEKIARDHLSDSVVLGTMMLAHDEVDGLVSGAVHSSANTVRPAMQLIKTRPSAKIASSIFFMCLPDQVLVYGDCAINPDPNAEELADIAIQSVDSAIAFGIDPMVAMISYSTLGSGAGKDVDKVIEATRIVKELRPDITIDGPLQYDAAAIADVAKTKAPDSPVAGKANVFIFPDLNTGNTVYKAVQRSANVVSIGPMLQGLRKPVNDLSRGALVDDIIYTIALTAIQAQQND